LVTILIISHVNNYYNEKNKVKMQYKIDIISIILYNVTNNKIEKVIKQYKNNIA